MAAVIGLDGYYSNMAKNDENDENKYNISMTKNDGNVENSNCVMKEHTT